MSLVQSLQEPKTEQQLQIKRARFERLKSTLVYLLAEYNDLSATVSRLHQELADEKLNLAKITHKRKNLSKQNFSAAQHLQKTHTKYWRTAQQHQRRITELKEQLKEYTTDMTELRYRIPEIREKIMDYLVYFRSIEQQIK